MMSELEIKERIAAITGEQFADIQLTPYEQILKTLDAVDLPQSYFWVSDAFLCFDSAADFGSTDARMVRVSYWDNSFTTRFQFNMSGPTGHHTINPLQINMLLRDFTIQTVSALTDDVSVFVRGYVVEIIP
jgi:hypothetical protein